ncbi:hypothetical protein SAMN05421636_10273 [Pricia antarctica]|uniref:Beta-lactamase-inhibitor-like, PepSY-like n=1 Tax=Pricia antarctica TaxID=641691 RepID=A0A1G6Y0Z7_9FLAO|nr:hypothetical protein [Pricia antarctica]SDD84089.1 hypothetical protein SAMN05421636_10273 [Pricia antarctica]
MKNLMIAAVFALGTMTAFAQEENAVEETATEATEAVDQTATDATEAVEENATEATEAVEETADAAQDGFNEVATEEIPEAITTALEAAHPGATVDKASMNGESQYKLEVNKEDGESAELYMDAEGNMIDM